MSKEFLKTRLVGKRFEAHSLPLEFLRDFKAYEDLIRNIAKALYLKEHEGRVRIPRGFFDNFTLHLKSIGAGSTELVLERAYEDGTVLPFDDHFEKAQTVILDSIDAMSTGKPLPSELSIDYIRYFDRFGESLKDDERMDLFKPKGKTAVAYNREVRKKLVLSQSATYTAHTELRGYIEELDLGKESFKIRTIGGVAITIPLKNIKEEREVIIDALKAYDTKTKRFLIVGTATYDKGDKLREFTEVQDFRELDANDIPARLEEISLLKDGWLDGEGKAPNTDHLQWVEDVFKHFPDELPLPLLFPTEEGNIQAEWSEGNSEISALFNFNEKSITIESLNLETNKPQTKAVTEEKFSKTMQTLLGKKTKE